MPLRAISTNAIDEILFVLVPRFCVSLPSPADRAIYDPAREGLCDRGNFSCTSWLSSF
jgi:hypothetical protein